MTSDGLSPRQKRFVAALLEQTTIAEAAAQAGVTKRTGLRYMKDPAVKRALGQELDVVLGHAAQLAARSMDHALATLHRIHRDTKAPYTARVSAARAIIEAGPKLRESYDLAVRVAELEDIIGDRR